jgi:hypothetical protein
MHNGELHDKTLANISRVIKSRRIRCRGPTGMSGREELQ